MKLEKDQRVDGVLQAGNVPLTVLGFHPSREYSGGMGVIVQVRETVAFASHDITYTRGEVFVTDQINLTEPEEPKVWVFTVQDDESPQPAVYVSNTEQGAWNVMAAGQGIEHLSADSEAMFDWFERKHKVTSLDSYYVETGL